MADLDFNDALKYLSNDKETKVILLYIENLRNGKLFMHLIKKCKKPVIVVKSGKGMVSVSIIGGFSAGMKKPRSLLALMRFFKLLLINNHKYLLNPLLLL